MAGKIGCFRTHNRYNDVEISLNPLGQLARPSEGDFIEFVRDEERAWKARMDTYTRDRDSQNAAIMWLKLPREYFYAFGCLIGSAELRFTLHHAAPDYIMLARRRNDAPSGILANAPPFGTHYVKVECLVVELGAHPRYLMVREKYASGADRSRNHKLITGGVLLGERIDEAAVREVREETMISANFVGLIGMIQRTNTRFCRDEIICGCVLHANPGQRPTPDRRELLEAFWETVDVALDHCNPPAYRWIKAAGRAGTANLLKRSDHQDLRGGPHFVSVFAQQKKAVS